MLIIFLKQTGARLVRQMLSTRKDRITSDGNLATGSKFTDASKIYHSDLNYNFSHLIDFADIMVGGSWRQYSLNSEGTIYADYDGAINYKEYGAYLQVKKNLLEERLKLTARSDMINLNFLTDSIHLEFLLYMLLIKKKITILGFIPNRI